MKHLNLKIHGKVQMVFFRDCTKKQADKLGLFGWVRNNDDKTVSVSVEGKEKRLKEFLAWCHKGPPLAKVEKINEDWSDVIKGFKSFEIIRGMF
jgi:acylphosphatase